VSAPLGVVLFNLGAPGSLEDVPGYIRRLLSDADVMPLPWPVRGLVAALIARARSKDVAEHYRAIGGKSPLCAQTLSQAEALGSALGCGYAVRFAMRHSAPNAFQALSHLASAGVSRVVALAAYPQWTRSTSGSAIRELGRAGRRVGVQVRHAPSFPDAPGYIDALAAAALPLLSAGCHLLVTAHGLPLRAIDGGDPYLGEVSRTFAALQKRLPPGTRCSLAFQSRVGRMAWTGPSLENEVKRLAREGARALVVLPISFVSENLETLYELDIEIAAHARECGVNEFSRVSVPGCQPAFIAELARIVHSTAQEAGWKDRYGN
jgi:protoporphyrin/coproporphyrin ferrochelatase